MSADDWVGFSLALFFTVLIALKLPAVWRNEHGFDPDVPPPGWIFDPASWRALVRTYPATVGMMAFGVPFALLSVFPDAAPPAMYVTGAATLAFTVLAVSTAVANRPKWLVAPHLRHQPGLIAEWGGAPCADTPPPKNAPAWQRRRRRVRARVPESGNGGSGARNGQLDESRAGDPPAPSEQATG